MQLRESLQRAFSSFLAVPTAVILGFVLLAIGSYSIEQGDVGFLAPFRDFMRSHVFGDPESTSALLGTIATGVITITSITFSLLLLALQQSAGSMTHQVFDQFLRRRSNQVYFGVFVGITLFALITLATVDPPFNPVLGASIALTLTTLALYVLLLLIYSTISQMRPTEIIKTIHDHTLRARERQLALIDRTRREAQLTVPHSITIRAPCDGFVTGINVDAMTTVIDNAPDSMEIIMSCTIGTYVAYQDAIAEVRTSHPDDPASIAEAVARAITLGRQRDLGNDPAYGIEQLETIAWRSISTSQQNPSPGLAAVHNVRDLLARWAALREKPDEERLAIVYPDNVMAKLFGAFESLSVVASESMQHQIYAEIVGSLSGTLDRLSAPDQQTAVNLLLRTISGLGDHVLTTELDGALTDLIHTLQRTGYLEAAARIQTALDQLGKSIGELNSRATRVPSTG